MNRAAKPPSWLADRKRLTHTAMAIEVLLMLAVFAAAIGFAWSLGGTPERAGAAIIAAWVAVSVIHDLMFGPAGFVHVNVPHAAFDLAELIAILWLALRANRLWPLWAAAAQLICVSGHFAALIEPGGMRRAYWAMTQIPPFIQIAALALGAIAHARRERRIGRYRSWRPA